MPHWYRPDMGQPVPVFSKLDVRTCSGRLASIALAALWKLHCSVLLEHAPIVVIVVVIDLCRLGGLRICRVFL